MTKEDNSLTHIAIIMDGNGRWATKRGLPRSMGHKKGAETVKEITRAAGELGVKYLTLYAFSTENWQRSPDEVETLMGLLRQYLKSDLQELQKNNVRIRFIGERDMLAPDITAAMAKLEADTAGNDGLTLCVALSYGSRQEIVSAVKKAAALVKKGDLQAEDIDAKMFSEMLYTQAMPDPDLVIRTSGEQRVSNYLLWQIAYSELFFTKTLWPDFNKDELTAIINDFKTRERRYGKTKAAAIVKRIVTSLILAPVVLWAVYCGSPVVNLLALTGGALLAWEWAAMVPNGKASVYGIIYTVSVATAVLTSSAPVIATVILAATLLVWLKAGEEKHRRLLTLGVPYISLGIGSLVWLFNLVGAYTTIWFVLVIWSVDIGGYLVGSNVKGPKLAPKISPNKTWSGLLGGMVFAAAVSVGYSHWLGSQQAYLAFALFGMIIAVVEQMGDLIESSIKRHLGLKDSSNLIPGHGGIFDRIDGMIFAAPLVALVLRYGFLLF